MTDARSQEERQLEEDRIIVLGDPTLLKLALRGGERSPRLQKVLLEILGLYQGHRLMPHYGETLRAIMRSKSFDPHLADRHGNNLFHYMFKCRGDLEYWNHYEFLQESGVDLLDDIRDVGRDAVRDKNNQGLEPFHIALDERVYSTVDGIVGVAPESLSDKMPDGQNGLHWISRQFFDVDSVLKMIKKCPRLANIPDAEGSYPINTFATSYKGSDFPELFDCRELEGQKTRILDALASIDGAPDYSTQDSKGRSILICLITAPCYHEYRSSGYEFTDEQAWGSINNAVNKSPSMLLRADSHGQNVLHYCVRTASLPLNALKFMIFRLQLCGKRTKNKILGMRDDYGNTPLHYVHEHSQYDLIEYLVDQNPNMCNVENQEGYTPLMMSGQCSPGIRGLLASELGNFSLIHEMLECSNNTRNLRSRVSGDN